MAIDVQQIEREIQKSCPNSTARLDVARKAIQVYQGSYEDPERHHYDGDERSGRDLPIMAKVIDTLTGPAYKSAPTRVIPDRPDATEFLEKIYKDNRMTSLFSASDKYAHAGDFAVFQVHATGNKNRPVQITLWPADSVVVWADPDEPLTPAAVCTIDRYDHQTRYRLWTKDELRTYVTKKWNGETSGGRVPYWQSTETNPYGRLPFSWVYYRLPTNQLETPGIGNTLANAQKHVNWRLQQLADYVRFSKPVGILKNVAPDQQFPKNPRAGEFHRLPPTKLDARGEYVDPEVAFIAPDSYEFIEKDWEDLQYYWTMLLQSVGLPPSAMPMTKVVEAAASGTAILYSNLAIYQYGEQRQELFKFFETDLAEVVFAVASSYYKLPYSDLADGLELQIDFASTYPDIPNPDKQAEDQWLLDEGLMSKVDLAMKRYGLTREQAVERLKQVREDNEMFAEKVEPDPEQAVVVPEDGIDQPDENNEEINKEAEK